MKKLKIKKKVLSIFMIICIASTMFVTVSASDASTKDIVGNWTLNEHVQPPDPNNESAQVLQGFTFEYTFNNVTRTGTSLIFTVVDDPDATKLYKMGIVYSGGIDYVYEGWYADGGWSRGEFNSYFSRTINVTSAYGGQSSLNTTYQWLSTNGTKSGQMIKRSFITINSTSISINFIEGSTWAEWVESQYNVPNVTTDGTYLYLNNQRMYDNSGNWVRINNVISAYSGPGLAYFFRSYDKTFTIYNGERNITFTYLSTISTWAEYVPTNPDFYIDEYKVYYLGEQLTQNNQEVRAEDTINNTTYEIKYSDEWYQGYLAGYEYGISQGGAILDIGSIIDGVISGAKSIFVNSFGFELFGINIASTLISILVIAIVIFVAKKLR